MKKQICKSCGKKLELCEDCRSRSEGRIIRKVWKNKGTKQLLITIPKDKDIKEGDYVEVKRK